MTRRLPWLLAWLVALCAAGCGGSDSEGDRLARDSLETMRALTEALKPVQDNQSARAAAARVAELYTKLNTLRGEVDRYRRAAGSDENSRLDQKYAQEMKAAGQALMNEVQRVAQVPGADVIGMAMRGIPPPAEPQEPQEPTRGVAAAPVPPASEPFAPSTTPPEGIPSAMPPAGAPAYVDPAVPPPGALPPAAAGGFGRRVVGGGANPNPGFASGIVPPGGGGFGDPGAAPTGAPFGAQPPGGFDPSLQDPQQRLAEQSRKMIERFGPNGVVMVTVAGAAGTDAQQILGERLKALCDDPANCLWLAFTQGNATVVTLGPVTDLRAFAAKIDFGKVTRTDAARRMVAVTADRTKLRPAPDKKEAGPARSVDALLADLRSPDLLKRRDACEKLAQLPANERRKEVAEALVALMTDADVFTRRGAATALGVWGTPEQTRALTTLLHDQDTFVRGDVLRALGALKDERALGDIAARLVDFFDRIEASKALVEFGPAAEPEVLKYLRHADGSVRAEACKILKSIGTSACMPALEAATRDREFQVVTAAREALQAVALARRTPARPAAAAPAAAPSGAGTGSAAKPDAESAAGKLGAELAAAGPGRQLEIIRVLQESKGAEFTQVLTESIPKLSGPSQIRARAALAERLTRMSARTLRGYLQDENPELRRAAAAACADKGPAQEFVPDLISLLTDDSEEAARAAQDALVSLTGKRIKFDPAASKAERRLVAQEWKTWWEANSR